MEKLFDSINMEEGAERQEKIQESLAEITNVNLLDEESKSVWWKYLDEFLKCEAMSNYDFFEYILFFVENGADLNFVDKNSEESILMRFVSFRNDSVIKFVGELLIKDVFGNINEIDKGNKTTLDYALRNPRDNTDLVKILLQKGATLFYEKTNLDIIYELVIDSNSIFYDGKYSGEPNTTPFNRDTNPRIRISFEDFYIGRNKKISLLYQYGLGFNEEIFNKDPKVIEEMMHKEANASLISLNDLFNDVSSVDSDDLFNMQAAINVSSPKVIEENRLEKLLFRLIEKSLEDEYLELIYRLLLEKIDLDLFPYLTLALAKNDIFHAGAPLIFKHNYGIINLLLNHGADYKKCYSDCAGFYPKSDRKKSFISFLDTELYESHADIWKKIQQIEYMKYNMKFVILPSIKNLHQKFIMHPDSLLARLTSIKWQLQQKSAEKVLEDMDPGLKAYFGIYDIDSLSSKVFSHLSFVE